MQQVSGVTRHHVMLTIVINIMYGKTAQTNETLHKWTDSVNKYC